MGIQEGLSFSPQLVCNLTKILGHTGGSFFFIPIWAKTLPKLRSRGLLLRQKVFYFFSPQLVRDLTKILGTLEKKILKKKFKEKKHIFLNFFFTPAGSFFF